MQTQANRLLEQTTVSQTDPLLHGRLIYGRERIKEKRRKDGIIKIGFAVDRRPNKKVITEAFF